MQTIRFLWPWAARNNQQESELQKRRYAILRAVYDSGTLISVKKYRLSKKNFVLFFENMLQCAGKK